MVWKAVKYLSYMQITNIYLISFYFNTCSRNDNFVSKLYIFASKNVYNNQFSF